ncbi:unnamed protein product [Rangifer tarandus platyrhynchus]|uniref:Uncharacterized protein n=1 Tax=Rangifer tarandus platyrhynchus TaxID=3082113 RepID=A0ABN8XML4_RANTA|nr:unnamed protein product [Rangifer tarandus platyrhynchus]
MHPDSGSSGRAIKWRPLRLLRHPQCLYRLAAPWIIAEAAGGFGSVRIDHGAVEQIYLSALRGTPFFPGDRAARHPPPASYS